MDRTTTPTAHPLQWPMGRPRTPAGERTRSRFGKNWASKPTVAEGSGAVYLELERLGCGDWNVVISTNLNLRLDGRPRSGQPEPADPGVAVFFRLEGEPYVIACDRWDRVGCNLLAVAKHIEALRGIERWGCGSVREAFAGYKRLPPPPTSSSRRHWRVVLQLDEPGDQPVTVVEVREAYRSLARDVHPDRPDGSLEAMTELNRARDEALAELAGGRTAVL